MWKDDRASERAYLLAHFVPEDWLTSKKREPDPGWQLEAGPNQSGGGGQVPKVRIFNHLNHTLQLPQNLTVHRRYLGRI